MNFVMHHGCFPLDCMGCGSCVQVCPSRRAQGLDVRRQRKLPRSGSIRLRVKQRFRSRPTCSRTPRSRIRQFKKPLLEFSGSCAGCAETPYARLITQVFGDNMYISNATGCSSIWGGPLYLRRTPLIKQGHGPAWANSLFEDNAEHGLGMYAWSRSYPRAA